MRPVPILAALTLLTLIPAAAADDPASSAFYAAGGVVVCGLAGVDAALVNFFEPWTGGAYPGRQTVRNVIWLLSPEGDVGSVASGIGRALGGTWGAIDATRTSTVNAAEAAIADGIASGAILLNGTASDVHDIKCQVTYGILFPTWDAHVKPRGDCMFDPGGPMMSWLAGRIPSPGSLPTVPPPPPCL